MIKEHFLGRYPSHFRINPIVKAYIISESLVWSGWNLVIPIAALFVTNSISGGNVQIAAIGFSIYLLFRVVFELISGKVLLRTTDQKKLIAAVVGSLFTSLALFSFTIAHTIPLFFFCYALGGIGFGIGMPAKNALFSIHIDKNKEATEWGFSDAIQFICMAFATALGGFIAALYGFEILFFVAGCISVLGTIPYVLQLLR